MEAYGENCPEELRNPEDLKLISEPLDFLGINVYQSGRVESDGQGGYREAKNPCGAPVTAMKWQGRVCIMYRSSCRKNTNFPS